MRLLDEQLAIIRTEMSRDSETYDYTGDWKRTNAKLLPGTRGLAEVAQRSKSLSCLSFNWQSVDPREVYAQKVRGLRPPDLRNSQTSEVSHRQTSATPKHQRSHAARPLQLSTSEVSRRQTSATPKHQKSHAARPPQLPDIRGLTPPDLCNSQTSEVSRRQTSATLKHQRSHAARPLQTPKHQQSHAARPLRLPGIGGLTLARPQNLTFALQGDRSRTSSPSAGVVMTNYHVIHPMDSGNCDGSTSS